MTVAYCGVCDWERRTGEDASRHDLNRAMIDHYVETGHSPIATTDADSPSHPAAEDVRPSP